MYWCRFVFNFIEKRSNLYSFLVLTTEISLRRVSRKPEMLIYMYSSLWHKPEMIICFYEKMNTIPVIFQDFQEILEIPVDFQDF